MDWPLVSVLVLGALAIVGPCVGYRIGRRHSIEELRGAEARARAAESLITKVRVAQALNAPSNGRRDGA